MRVFDDMKSAVLEIQRDVYKGSKLSSSRVQQWTDLELEGRERIGYDYGIRGGFPQSPSELVALGDELGLKMYQGDSGIQLQSWLSAELQARIYPYPHMTNGELTELMHPALKKTLEGKYPSYTYSELLAGSMEMLTATILAAPDTRRAFWPMFKEVHALRAPFPTRVPCSIGYHAMLRVVPGEVSPKLFFTYLQRSADFDTFLLSDIWLARQFQQILALRLNVEPGLFMHHIISLHSFTVEGTEIY